MRQAELAVAKAEADLARLTDLYEHSAVAQKEVLAAKTAEALATSARGTGADRARTGAAAAGVARAESGSVPTAGDCHGADLRQGAGGERGRAASFAMRSIRRWSPSRI